MRKVGNLAVIGSGPSALYFLHHLLEHLEDCRDSLESITVLEKSSLVGYGMPYHPETTDRYNRSNISSEELPPLPDALVTWLRSRSRDELSAWEIEKEEVNESGIYCRLALGEYFHNQFLRIVALLRDAGIPVRTRKSCSVSDVRDFPEEDCVLVIIDADESLDFDTLVIATGHYWQDEDRPGEGFYSSPWPIFKLLPDNGGFLNHSVGTLGASLSAFDVIASLSHRHGNFEMTDSGLVFHPHRGTEDFEVVMHAAEGWLPHLQWDQVEPFREIYRHVTRENLLALREENGFLRLEKFFDHVCRPVLIEALNKDGMVEVVDLLKNDALGIDEFVDEMSERHEYVDSFEGMRRELVEAEESVNNHFPIHWKESLDDLMYCLNYHAELMPAEDHLVLRKKVMPFLMNVIAALPLESAMMLLALYDAGKVRLVAGKVKIDDRVGRRGTTRVTVEGESGEEEFEYRMFVDCSGQSAMESKDFPFSSLVERGSIREARAGFVNQMNANDVEPEKILIEGDTPWLKIGGIEIDAAFRIIGDGGSANPRIHDLSFPHTSGIRPYSYGLQACSASAEIMVKSWVDAVCHDRPVQGDISRASRSYPSG